MALVMFAGRRRMVSMGSESVGFNVEALPCNECSRQAGFLTPFGLKCPDHALATAIHDHNATDDGWLPIRIRPRGPSSDRQSKGVHF